MQRKDCQSHERMRSMHYGNHKERVPRHECPRTSDVVRK